MLEFLDSVSIAGRFIDWSRPTGNNKKQVLILSKAIDKVISPPKMFSTVNLFHPLSFNMELPETNSAPENGWLDATTFFLGRAV